VNGEVESDSETTRRESLRATVRARERTKGDEETESAAE